jgi:hypothetical protein
MVSTVVVMFAPATALEIEKMMTNIRNASMPGGAWSASGA